LKRKMKSRNKEELYWMDTKWGCGTLAVINGIVIDACPEFTRNFTGQRISALFKMYRVKKLGD